MDDAAWSDCAYANVLCHGQDLRLYIRFDDDAACDRVFNHLACACGYGADAIFGGSACAFYGAPGEVRVGAEELCLEDDFCAEIVSIVTGNMAGFDYVRWPQASLLKDTSPQPTEAMSTQAALAGQALAMDALMLKGLAEGSVALVSGRWLLQLALRGGAVPSRQGVPDDALLGALDVLDLEDEGALSDARGPIRFRCPVFALSYCWHTESHPDPEGITLRCVANVICRFLETFPVADVAVFWDWPCLRQGSHGLGDSVEQITWWHAHKLTWSLLVTWTPQDVLGEEVEPYGERGWPTFERAACQLVKDPALVLDLGGFGEESAGPVGSLPAWRDLHTRCMRGRAPPMSPSSFEQLIDCKSFTRCEDAALLTRRYTEAFQETTGVAEHLDLSGLKWTDLQAAVLCGALVHCSRLQRLSLCENSFGNVLARELGPALQRCAALRHLDLSRNHIGSIGAGKLAPYLAHPPHLKLVDLSHNAIGISGAARIVFDLRFKLACAVELWANSLAAEDVKRLQELTEALTMSERLQFNFAEPRRVASCPRGGL